MLDGLLGRGGFSSKCKSLLNLTKTRIDVIRRKREATQKFLKKDIADLLATGLEQNALGRAEGLFAEIILSSCYDFIDNVCDIILKDLSFMNKQRECPEDCKEAVASLMFAAARFSDLPELRELRDILQERYGSSAECKANQRLVEHITPKRPAIEQKLQVLKDIASEFSIRWDATAFERKLTNTPAAREGIDHPKAFVPPHDTGNKYLGPQVEEPVQKKDKDDRLVDKRVATASPHIKLRDALYKDHCGPIEARYMVHRHDDLNNKFSNGQDLRHQRHKPPLSQETVHKREERCFLQSKRGCMVDPEHPHPGRTEPAMVEKHKLDIGAVRCTNEKTQHNTLSQQRLESLPTEGEMVVESPIFNSYDRDNIASAARKQPGEEREGSKSKLKSSIPPAYVKPKRSKHRSKQPELHSNGEISDSLSHDGPKGGQGSNGPENKDANGGSFTAEYYKDDNEDTPRLPTPSRRSRRRRTKSSSSPDNIGEELRVVRRISTSTRRNESSRKGLQILFDDDFDNRRHKDEEEKMIDKLLLHYSKKDSPGGGIGSAHEAEVPRRRGKNEVLVNNVGDSSRGQRARGASNVRDEDRERQHTPRSTSLPRENMSCSSSSERKKVFMRAASFDHEASTVAKHVHPKLPDYDDLAARFAALKKTIG